MSHITEVMINNEDHRNSVTIMKMWKIFYHQSSAYGRRRGWLGKCCRTSKVHFSIV